MMVVWAIDRPRSSIISTRSRKLSLKRRYHRTHRTMTSRSKCRPLNRSSKPKNLATEPPHKPNNGLHDRGPTHLHQSRLTQPPQFVRDRQCVMPLELEPAFMHARKPVSRQAVGRGLGRGGAVGDAPVA